MATVNATDVIDGTKNQKQINDEIIYKIDSLSELKNLSPRLQNQRVRIRNYGIGELYWDSTSTELANDIDIFESSTTSVGRWKWIEFNNVAQGGVISDGVTDQTVRINQITARLGSIGFRGQIVIPENTKYDVRAVFSSLPIGLNLKIFDHLNWGQPPNYKNRMRISYSNGSTADDTLHMIADNHHPALSFLNTGDSGSPSAEDRSASIIHAVGISSNGDPLNSQILQFNKSTANKWQTSLRSLIPYAIATKDPSSWKAGKQYTAGDMCLSDNGKVYISSQGGVSGNTPPLGTGTNINDGNVIWDYYAPRRSRDATIFTIDEDGNAANYGNTSNITTYQVRNSKNRLILQVDNTTSGTISMRDYSRGLDFITSSTSRGVYLGGIRSLFFSNISGATPTISTEAARVSNSSAVDMTALNLPIGITHGFIMLHFVDSNTTLKSGSSFILKGGVDVNPPVNGIIQLIRNGSASSAWIEVSRSF